MLFLIPFFEAGVKRQTRDVKSRFCLNFCVLFVAMFELVL